jgi:hypothetical protein
MKSSSDETARLEHAFRAPLRAGRSQCLPGYGNNEATLLLLDTALKRAFQLFSEWAAWSFSWILGV